MKLTLDGVTLELDRSNFRAGSFEEVNKLMLEAMQRTLDAWVAVETAKRQGTFYPAPLPPWQFDPKPYCGSGGANQEPKP